MLLSCFANDVNRAVVNTTIGYSIASSLPVVGLVRQRVIRKPGTISIDAFLTVIQFVSQQRLRLRVVERIPYDRSGLSVLSHWGYISLDVYSVCLVTLLGQVVPVFKPCSLSAVASSIPLVGLGRSFG